MAKILIASICAFLTTLLLSFPHLYAAEPSFLSQSQLEMVPDDIIGVALYPDGQTPIVDLPVRVWSVDREKMIYRSRTDNEGVFKIPRLVSGKCYVFVGRVKINMKVLVQHTDALIQRHDFVVVLPRGYLVSSITPDMSSVLMIPSLLGPVEILNQPPKVVSP